MALDFYWILSTVSEVDNGRGEWRALQRPWAPPADSDSRAVQINHYDYLTQVARVAELTGFDGVVIPDDPLGEEPWIVAGTLIRETRRLELVTSIAPGAASAVYQGKMAASFQRFANDRQAWFVDGPAVASVELAEAGGLAPLEAATRTEELLTLTDGIWSEGPYSQEGLFFTVENGGLGILARNRRRPPYWLRDTASNTQTALDLRADVVVLPITEPHLLPDAIAAARSRYGASVRIAAEIALFARPEERDLAAEHHRITLRPNLLAGTFATVSETLSAWNDAGLDIVLLNADDQIREVNIAGEQIISRVRRLERAARPAA